MHDIAALIARSDWKITRLLTEGLTGFPDQEATITTDLSILEVVAIMEKIPDSHVMIETITPEAEYTGIRVYASATE